MLSIKQLSQKFKEVVSRSPLSQFVRQLDKKYFIFTYLTYFIGILSILQANVLYKTDYDRGSGLEGIFTNWRHTGRFLNDALTYVFTLSGIAVDISPLSQMIAIFFLTIASLILVKTVASKMTYTACFVSTMVGLSPYYLQVINYVFDSMYYSLSMLLSIVPFLFFNHKKDFYMASVICLFLCCMTFQCTISVYMIVTTYLFFTDFQQKHDFKRNLKEGVITSALFSMVLVFSCFIIRYYFSLHTDEGYIQQTISQSNLCKWGSCWDVFKGNFLHFLRYFGSFSWYRRPMGYLMEGVIICFLIYQIFNAKGLKYKIQNTLLSLFVLPIMFLFIGLWTLFFTFMWWNPRIWVGFGVFFSLLMIEMTNEQNMLLKRIFSFFSIALIWGCMVFSAHVGNLLKVEHEYEEFKIAMLSQDLSKLPDTHIYFKNKTISSPVLRRAAQKYPLLKDVVSGAQLAYDRWYHHVTAFYRPDLKLCRNFKMEFEQVILDNPHHKFTRINKDCLEIDVK